MSAAGVLEEERPRMDPVPRMRGWYQFGPRGGSICSLALNAYGEVHAGFRPLNDSQAPWSEPQFSTAALSVFGNGQYSRKTDTFSGAGDRVPAA